MQNFLYLCSEFIGIPEYRYNGIPKILNKTQYHEH